MKTHQLTLQQRMIEDLLTVHDSASVAVWFVHDNLASGVLRSHGSPARQLVEREQVLGTGPGPEAIQTGDDVVVPDLRNACWAARWPLLGGWAEDHGISGCAVVPVVVGRVIGGVTLVTSAAAVMPSVPQRVLRCYGISVFADAWADPRLDIDVAAVHQAVGLLAATHGVDPRGAAALLRAAAFTADMGLDDTARRLLQEHVRALV